LFVSSTGSDSGSCSQSRPCRSFDWAYRLARPGQTVLVAGGAYPDQRIGVDPTKTSGRDVVFRPQRGAKVRLDKLVVQGRHLTLSGLILRHYWHVEPGAADVTFLRVRTGIFTIRSATDVRVIGGSVGPWDSDELGEDPQIGDWDRGSPQPRRVLIQGVVFRDLTRRENPDAHTDCLQFTGGVDVIIRGNRFRGCATSDVYIRGDFGPVRNFLIENNFFGRTREGFHSLRLSGPSASFACENFLIRNNSALQTMWSDCRPGGKGIRFVANVIDSQDRYHCSTSREAGARWSRNVYGRGVACGLGDLVARTGFRDPGRMDLRLRAGAAAINRGDRRNYPRFDIEGERRPKGGRPDAGADEAR
jgi:hypothetical protein